MEIDQQKKAVREQKIVDHQTVASNAAAAAAVGAAPAAAANMALKSAVADFVAAETMAAAFQHVQHHFAQQTCFALVYLQAEYNDTWLADVQPSW